MNKHFNNTRAVVGMLILLTMAGNLQARRFNNSVKNDGTNWMVEMNLDQQQMRQINQLRDELQPAIMDIRHKNRTMEVERDRLKRSEHADLNRLTVLNQSIRANNQSIAALQLEHRAQIRLLLTPDQRITYDRHSWGGTAMNQGWKSRSTCPNLPNAVGFGHGKRG